jgi:enoyl-CoA hydratase/carnithine racemase
MDGVTMQPHLAGHAGVCEITLDRPEVLNAINTAMAARLAQACAELAANPHARAVVLSGAGARAFCVGADLKERNGLDDAGLMAQREVFRAAFGGLLGLPQPVVAAVHGYALGGGCELALSCDLIVADETAVFGLPETTVGLVPGGAERIGLIDRLVPDGKACQQALELAQQIAANSPVAVRAAKRAIRRGWGIGVAEALDVEDAAWRATAISADRREGIAAFNDKRAPNWPGL